MQYNYNTPRIQLLIQELRETDRRTFVLNGFVKNDSLRDSAGLLGILFGFIIVLSLCILVGGFSSNDMLLACSSIPSIVTSPVLLVWKSSLKRKADLLDYQLMIAFPDWKELISKVNEEDSATPKQ
ncbi:hypothetical protein [uncultured Porphyromonas sp.]|uniref:hypothetical protein n=1 Tax=uncultured Porphyromonas sp. TaxID=159274 RepID=UPI00260B423A|nr:hypothetical protein [uncultured Porphyromonas sp.]